MTKVGRAPDNACFDDVIRPTDTAVGLDFDDVYDRHVDFLWRMVRRLGVPESSLADAVQDVLMIVHRRPRVARVGVGVGVWVRRAGGGAHGGRLHHRSAGEAHAWRLDGALAVGDGACGARLEPAAPA
jgi:hypothetical protein